ncbi:4-hydroxythreonine-4-phosphate dehydrogenase PdxA [Desulfohalobiaceae bacterium Ax17]|uniref:4-hydroxythreonine-4-phosphate dehydrogenase PdxA n=1 Tax=Desulfovulcanus ferrireducens TaxID=2831190 RepID=UPI00207BCAC4|nr:4-hydroxythreonine-4-phosphate dehydrogenase PdxA [Desulfovulcanus ferrireducens]MBT8762495.1 4-hydroxythreonine-4-phosphate dehydrogenase PdxA [Desulfovulcanus ferrireducens]
MGRVLNRNTDQEPQFIVYTMGDPNGLGPELICSLELEKICSEKKMLIIGLEEALDYHCRHLKKDKFWSRIDDIAKLNKLGPGIYLMEPEGLEKVALKPGHAHVHGGLSAGRSLDLACTLLKVGMAGALVTGPLNKAMLQEAGFDFAGHTEFLGERFGVGKDKVCMHLWGEKLRVSLATTHPPLRQVPELISIERVVRCLKLTFELMKKMDLASLPIGVCGLNPHAGEMGKIGREEIEIIGPAVEEAKSLGVNAEGPYPADTLFYQAAQGKFSSVLAMYHDQGLGPLKLLHFGQAVNITLGLPIVRTSVDHGTGYDLVGTGKADPGSLKQAIFMAEQLAG